MAIVADDVWSWLSGLFGGTSAKPKTSSKSSSGSQTLSRKTPVSSSRSPSFDSPTRREQDSSPAPVARGASGGRGRSFSVIPAAAPTPPPEKKMPSGDEVVDLLKSKGITPQLDQRQGTANSFWDDLSRNIGNMGNTFVEGANKFSEQYDKEGTLPNGLGGHSLPTQEQRDARDAAKPIIAAEQAKTDRSDYQTQFSGNRRVQVRELSEQEWAALTPEQQRGVTANWLLYEAAQQDRELGQKSSQGDSDYQQRVREIFGEKGGSKEYAPNTVRVLSELGYKNDKSDLDLFLDGRATASEQDMRILQNNPEASGRSALFGELTQTLNGPDVQAALQKGAGLLDALRSTGTLSPETQSTLERGNARNIDPDRMERLFNVYQGLASPSVNQQIEQNAELSNRLRADLEEATAGLNPDDVYAAFRESSNQLNTEDNSGLFMPFDEFTRKWYSDKKEAK